ncbi:hypothetical protein K7A42_23670 [Agrobacterium sp. InxBP2]|uniref:trypco2 family protein n=1 Tax=Agrobacterium sp. InxBP2 TaxID=2870329 RepID=UPI000DB5CA13|nr:trypco2 family protein [Agrobacterium sp. InxBP2]MCW8283906.1 hypothetical protein [Agrobacterium sp. InxBP2]PZU82244.1 MAG: hypothetical protein DI528_20135 [Shinella sp.]
MELKDFIKATFIEIIDGVKEARDTGDDASGIASNMRNRIDKLGPGLMQDNNGALYSVVEFDVAVTASTKVDGSGGVNVMAFKLTGGGTAEDQTVSRVKFSIPMRFNVY